MMSQIHREGLYQVMGLMFYGATPLLLAHALNINEEEATQRALRVIEIITQHEPPDFLKR